MKPNPPTESPTNRPTLNALPSTFQPGLQRQQSLGIDKNIPVQRLPESNINNRASVKTVNNTNQLKRSSNGSSRILKTEQQKRF